MDSDQKHTIALLSLIIALLSLIGGFVVPEVRTFMGFERKNKTTTNENDLSEHIVLPTASPEPSAAITPFHVGRETPASTPLPSAIPSYPQTISTPFPPTRKPEKTWDRPHIYLHIADEAQRHAASELKRRLINMGYTVVGIENAHGNEDIPIQSSELRFFTSTDSAEAQRIVSEIIPSFGTGGIVADLPEGMPYVSHARQYEIWYSQAFR